VTLFVVLIFQVVELYSGRCITYDVNGGIVNPNRFWGLIGPHTSGVAVPVSKLLGLFNIPQVRL